CQSCPAGICSRCTIRCRPQLLGANASDATGPAADPAAVDTCATLSGTSGAASTRASFTGRGQEFPVALTDWQEKQTEALMRGASGGGSAMMEMFPPPAPLQQQRGHHSFEPPRPQEGRIAAVLLATAQPRCQAVLQGDSRAAAERVRPETDRRDRSAGCWRAGSTATCRQLGCPVQQQQWRAASQASSSRWASGLPERDRADAKDGGYGGGQAWGSELESRYRDYSRAPGDSRVLFPNAALWSLTVGAALSQAPSPTRTPGRTSRGCAEVRARRLRVLELQRRRRPDEHPRPARAAVGYLPGRPRLYELHDASSSAAPAAQKQQPLQQANVNFDTDVMVAYGYGSEPVYLDQEQLLRDSKQQQASTELHDLQRGYDRTQLRRQFHSEFPGRPDDLRDAVHEGRRHVIYGINSQVLHGLCC
uniref:DUF2263 domain-containing protein n=1 Tax=Macrostomum lignano TaxID=282301 RepID=A0A1I8JPJ9_9PLAT